MSGGNKGSSFFALTITFVACEMFLHVAIKVAQSEGALSSDIILNFLYVAPFAFYIMETVELFTGVPFKKTLQWISDHFFGDQRKGKQDLPPDNTEDNKNKPSDRPE